MIVSNGKVTRFYDSYSGKPLDISNPDEKQLEQLFSNALEIAAEEKDKAIKILLGKDPLIWEKVIKDFNQFSF